MGITMEAQHPDNGILVQKVSLDDETEQQELHAFFNTWADAAQSGILTGDPSGSISHVHTQYCNWRPGGYCEGIQSLVKRCNTSLDILGKADFVKVMHKGLVIAFESLEVFCEWFGFRPATARKWFSKGAIPRKYGVSIA